MPMCLGRVTTRRPGPRRSQRGRQEPGWKVPGPPTLRPLHQRWARELRCASHAPSVPGPGTARPATPGRRGLRGRERGRRSTDPSPMRHQTRPWRWGRPWSPNASCALLASARRGRLATRSAHHHRWRAGRRHCSRPRRSCLRRRRAPGVSRTLRLSGRCAGLGQRRHPVRQWPDATPTTSCPARARRSCGCRRGPHRRPRTSTSRPWSRCSRRARGS
mmetsp:Transcript_26336/g.70302  ORF Transcript_26336/g.70302 Transcript_26336/m.70302 type:complete len:218 (-) Transcript_26336:394-1047(-)